MSARRLAKHDPAIGLVVFGLIAILLPNQTALAQPAAGPQLVIESASPDASGQTLTIRGIGFGSRPLVTLDLLPVNVQFAIDSQIVAAVPVNMMPAGKYVLTVSRGSSLTENASMQIALGNTLPQAAAAAPTALQPTLTLAASDAAARVGDRVISIGEVDREWSRTDPAAYLALARELYERRHRAAGKMVADELIAREAAARGLTPDALLEQELPKRTITTPDSAVVALYQTLGDRARGATLEQMRPALRAWLARVTEPEIAKMNYVEELMKVSTRANGAARSSARPGRAHSSGHCARPNDGAGRNRRVRRLREPRVRGARPGIRLGARDVRRSGSLRVQVFAGDGTVLDDDRRGRGLRERAGQVLAFS